MPALPGLNPPRPASNLNSPADALHSRSALGRQRIPRAFHILLRRRASAFERHVRIHVVQSPRAEHHAICRFDLIGAISQQFRRSYCACVSRQCAHARVPMPVRAEREIEFPGTIERNAKIRRHHQVSRGIQVHMRLDRAGIHAQQQVVFVVRCNDRDSRPRTHTQLAATR